MTTRTINSELCYVVPSGGGGCSSWSHLPCVLVTDPDTGECRQHKCGAADNNGIEIVFLTRRNYARHIAARLTS